MTEQESNDILKLIVKRRRQILIHSIVYYELDENLITDSTWSKWAVELEELQTKYPEIAKHGAYADEFKDFDHSTGQNLPLRDPWATSKARQLLRYSHERGIPF